MSLDKTDLDSKLSKYKMLKIVDTFAYHTSIHHVCFKCQEYISKQSQTSTDSKEVLYCKKCKTKVNIKKNYERGNFFLYISLGAQLKMLFSKHSDSILYTTNRFKKNKYAYEEILDGDRYKKNCLEYSISINFSYDCVPVFKSSSFSMHPILCTVNELSPELRINEVLLCGLWFGKKKSKSEYILCSFRGRI